MAERTSSPSLVRTYGGKTPEQRFWEKVDKSDDCWTWTASTYLNGYGQSSWNRQNTPAHRVAYILARGAIPEGMTVDHQCHNRDLSCDGGSTCPHRLCVNPAHLAAVPIGQNAKGSKNYYANKTHCKNGHEFTPENTFRQPRGRGCRECRRAASRRYLQRKKAESDVEIHSS